MVHVLSATVPIFLVVGLGFVLTRGGLFKRKDMTVLSRFVVKVALPLLIFANIYGRSPGEIFQPAYLLTYAGAAIVMFAIAFTYTRIRGLPALRSAFMGAGMAGTNNGFVGFPIFLILFADWAGAAVGMGMIVDNVFIIPLTLLLAEQATGTGTVRARIVATIKGVALHPMVIAIVAALVLNSIGLELPTFLDRGVDLLASASTGVALFSVGGMLVGLHVRAALPDIITMVSGKLLVMPAVALGLVALFATLGLPELPAELRAAVVLTCALPPYSILPSLAEPYGEADITTAAMMLSTLLSFLSLTGWMLILQVMGWM